LALTAFYTEITYQNILIRAARAIRVVRFTLQQPKIHAKHAKA